MFNIPDNAFPAARDQPATLDSPTRNYAATSKSPNQLPFFARSYVDHENQPRVDFTETPVTRVDVTLEQLEQLLKLEYDIEGQLAQPDWKSGIGKSRYWKSQWLLDIIAKHRPKHFIPKVTKNFVFSWKVDGKTKGKRGGRDKSHKFDGLYFVGLCAAEKHGCTNTFYGGMTKDDIEELFHRRAHKGRLEIHFTGNCCNHLRFHNYNRFNGPARRKYIASVVSGRQLTRPKQFVENSLGGKYRSCTFSPLHHHGITLTLSCRQPQSQQTWM